MFSIETCGSIPHTTSGIGPCIHSSNEATRRHRVGEISMYWIGGIDPWEVQVWIPIKDMINTAEVNVISLR